MDRITYLRQTWKNQGEDEAIPLNSTDLNHIEDGIVEATEGVNACEVSIEQAQSDIESQQAAIVDVEETVSDLQNREFSIKREKLQDIQMSAGGELSIPVSYRQTYSWFTIANSHGEEITFNCEESGSSGTREKALVSVNPYRDSGGKGVGVQFSSAKFQPVRTSNVLSAITLQSHKGVNFQAEKPYGTANPNWVMDQSGSADNMLFQGTLYGVRIAEES